MQDGPNIVFIGDQRKEPNVNKYEGKMQSGLERRRSPVWLIMTGD